MGKILSEDMAEHPTPLGPTIVISTKDMLMIRQSR
jgi:hypothetical protein